MTSHRHLSDVQTPFAFAPLPALPTLEASVLQEKPSPQPAQKHPSRAWLLAWVLPVLGGVLSFNVAMADSIVPTMADKQAHSNVRFIRLIIDADARESSGRLEQHDAPEQEQWMADTPSQTEKYDEVDLAKYVPLIQNRVL
jgi:hypothetical protein